jgi:SARP family transcriptional regulator, regulator of embCAB operon
MLAMHANEPVPMENLIHELWGKTPPSTAKTTVQTYVMHIRKLISRALAAVRLEGQRQAKQELVTTPGGYELMTSPDGVDRWHFERFTSAGHRAREKGDYETASKQFCEALNCWRGRALADVQVGEHLKIDIQRLEEARLNALDCRIEADLRLGRHHELLGELAAVVRQYPSHEGLTAHLMAALYRSGRRWDALEAYQRLYACLDDLGLEPSPPLRRLHRTMLVCDRSSGDLTDGWTTTTTHGGRVRTVEQPSDRLGGNRAGRIPVALASIPWQANGMTNGT